MGNLILKVNDEISYAKRINAKILNYTYKNILSYRQCVDFFFCLKKESCTYYIAIVD